MCSSDLKWLLPILNCADKDYSLADQCPAMAADISRVFILALHKLCRWHMIKKFREPLRLLYKLHPSFKVEFNAVLN